MFEPEETQDILVCAALETHGGSRIEGEPVLDPALERLTKHAVNDTAYQKVHEAVKGCKTPHNLPTSHPAQAFKSQWDALSTDLTLAHLLLYHGCIVLPEAAKKEVLKTQHVQHTDESKTLANARQIYFWLGMTADIKFMVASCQECQPFQLTQRMEPQIRTMTSRPFEAVSVDLGYLNGTHHLVLMNRYSGWPHVKPLKKLDTASVTSTLEDWFLDYGKPVSLRSDGGPQF